MIQFLSEKIEIPRFDQPKIARWIQSVAARYGKKTGNIHYIFCSDERMLEINRQFLQHDYYTDIITFDYSVAQRVAGDIFIGVETVFSNAAEREIDFGDELHRVIIHGVLHLCGLDDKTPETRQTMRNSEDEALATLAAQ